MKHTTSYIGEKIEGTSHENNNATSENISPHIEIVMPHLVLGLLCMLVVYRHTRGRQISLPTLFNALFVVASGYYTSVCTIIHIPCSDSIYFVQQV